MASKAWCDVRAAVPVCAAACMRASLRGAEDDAMNSARIAFARRRRFMPRRDHGPAERPCQTSEAFDLAMAQVMRNGAARLRIEPTVDCGDVVLARWESSTHKAMLPREVVEELIGR